MRRWIGLIGAFIAFSALGVWLWFREGAEVWIDAVIAFCT